MTLLYLREKKSSKKFVFDEKKPDYKKGELRPILQNKKLFRQYST